MYTSRWETRYMIQWEEKNVNSLRTETESSVCLKSKRIQKSRIIKISRHFSKLKTILILLPMLMSKGLRQWWNAAAVIPPTGFIWKSPRSTLSEIERRLILIFAHCHQHIEDYSRTILSVCHPKLALIKHFPDMSLVTQIISVWRGCDSVAAHQSPHNGRESGAL